MLKYIGPFLRMNKLNIEQIKCQLFHLSKESIKNIVLHSKCGIIIDPKDLSFKNISSTDINTLDLNSPLLCIYKKASAELKVKDNTLHWSQDKIKKDIYISSNAYMTLCLLELIDYYNQFKDIAPDKYVFSNLYTKFAQKQLDFYASYLRNEEGVFVDKKDCTDSITGKIKLKNKNKPFKFSDQALLMNAYYKCSTYLDDKHKDSYRNFSYDILNMFIEFKEEMYDISFQEQCKVCLNLNVFYTYSKMDNVKLLLLDIFDLIYENYNNNISNNYNLTDLCLLHLNSMLLYKHTSMDRFKNIGKKLYKLIKKYYDEDSSIFVKSTEDKEIDFSAKEILVYVISNLYQNYITEEDNDRMIINVFTNQLVDSGIILSWPDVPNLDDIEHYKDFQEKPENLLDEQYFKMPTIASPEANELAPVFVKSVTYNKSKKTFKQSKANFDSRKNLEVFFLTLHLLNNSFKDFTSKDINSSN
ncbi:hypothetical protein [Clostridium ganghwense]|uniref:Uncharacterized protein n=1 Tax=Clostridium ganghwense TaxID=312089 RepID=A0ABT4CKZ4_9CLOT|nr:hypothetical protein [Clostridium ganghwense]MCY6369715.1 hypothetical protein [Clostridium ganghwense]